MRGVLRIQGALNEANKCRFLMVLKGHNQDKNHGCFKGFRKDFICGFLKETIKTL